MNTKMKFKAWCAKENRLFTDKFGEGEHFTNGEVLEVHVAIIIGVPAIFAAQALIESLPW